MRHTTLKKLKTLKTLKRHDLVRLIASTSLEHRIVLRARMVVFHLFHGLNAAETARRCATSEQMVRKWTRRFRENPSYKSLCDRPRSGRPARLTALDEAVVLSLACQKPEAWGRLETRATQAMIAEEAAKTGSLSRSSVQRILSKSELKPHRQRYFLFTPKDNPEYAVRRDELCDLYTQKLPPDEIVVCYDEKSGIQVLGTPSPGRNARPGQPELIEHTYRRLGTRNLVVAMRVDTGELVEWELFPARGYKTPQAIEMLQHISAALSEYRVIHLVWDNASTHRSKAMKDFLTSPLGQHFRVHFTPTHASWLNQAETVFSKFSRRFLAKRRWDCLELFDATIYACLEIYNGTVASPARWRYNPARKAS